MKTFLVYFSTPVVMRLVICTLIASNMIPWGFVKRYAIVNTEYSIFHLRHYDTNYEYCIGSPFPWWETLYAAQWADGACVYSDCGHFASSRFEIFGAFFDLLIALFVLDGVRYVREIREKHRDEFRDGTFHRGRLPVAAGLPIRIHLSTAMVLLFCAGFITWWELDDFCELKIRLATIAHQAKQEVNSVASIQESQG